MNRLTADERRRANELRQIQAARRAARAVTLDEMQSHDEGWKRSARVATLVTVGAGGAIALLELAQKLSLYGASSLLDWLLPRL